MKKRRRDIQFGISAKMSFAIGLVSILIALISFCIATRLNTVLNIAALIDKNWVIAQKLVAENDENEMAFLLSREKDIYFSLSDKESANPQDKDYQSLYSQLQGPEYEEILSNLARSYDIPGIAWADLRFKDEGKGRYVYLMHTRPQEDGKFGIGYWEPDEDSVNCNFYYPKSYATAYEQMEFFPKWVEKASNVLPESIGFVPYVLDHLMALNSRNAKNRFSVLYPVVGEEGTEPIGYLGIGEYYNNYQTYNWAFALMFIIIFLPYFVIVTLVTRELVRRNIALPIQKLAKAAVIYGEDDDKENDDKHFKQVKIRSRDEVLLLRDSMADMEGSLAKYMVNLKNLTAKEERFKAEMDMSAQIQLGMLPHSLRANDNERDFAISASIKPAKSVGGDFYDFFEIDDDRIGIVMADVSGKGMPAALFMMIAKIILAASAKLSTSVEEIMKNANRQICANNPEMLFVTIWFGIYYVKDRSISYVNAGHDYPAVYKSSEGKFKLFEAESDLVIGFDPETEFVERRIKLESKDKLFLYTDGIPEANNPKGEMYGNDRMLAALDKSSDKSGDEFLEAVDTDVRSFIAEADQFDDMTMLLLEIK
ncbi:MAG: PP2C family protein-serine/threonine phosphatase [Butyrivibrio sp.]|nr:PP2C family protein-serine/threonine phosphatase [Butyrivibrio sp.]